MPILEREPDLYPEGLFQEPIQEKPWWVAYVRSRQEKTLARHLLSRSVDFYLPKRVNEVQRAGRRFTSYLPLFPGYVFCCGERASRLTALESNLIVQILDVKDQKLLHQELDNLHELQQSGLPLIPHPYLGPGDAVEIHDGPFKGYRGRVVREKGPLRLVVTVSLLRRSVAVELDRELLAPISDPQLSPRPAMTLS